MDVSCRILMVNSLDSTYGSTHRMRKFYHCLAEKGWNITYIESNCRENIRVISVFQPNNALGFLWGSAVRTWFALTLRYDLLFTQTMTPLTLGPILAARMRRKKVAVDWDDLSWVLQKNSFRSFLVRWCEHSFIRRADIVFVPNRYLSEYGRRLGVRKVLLAPHGVDFELFDPQRYNPTPVRQKLGLGNRTVLGFLASFTTGGVGDLDVIFEASKAVIEKLAGQVCLLVIGGGPLFDHARSQASAMGLKDIFFTGLISQEDVPSYLSCVDIALIFMRDDLKNTMKTSLKVGEYLAMDKRVVGHLTGQTRDDFARYCLECEPSVDSFIRRILEAMGAPARCVDARSLLRGAYSWDISCRIIDEALCAI